MKTIEKPTIHIDTHGINSYYHTDCPHCEDKTEIYFSPIEECMWCDKEFSIKDYDKVYTDEKIIIGNLGSITIWNKHSVILADSRENTPKEIEKYLISEKVDIDIILEKLVKG